MIHEIANEIRKYNNTIQVLNENPTNPNYKDRVNKIKEETERKIFEIVDSKRIS